MLTIGVDFSKRSSVYSVLNDEGQRLKRFKVPNDPKMIDQFFSNLPNEPKTLAARQDI